MEIVDLDTKPTGLQFLGLLAQALADQSGHVRISAAHFASALLEMEPVRSLIGDSAVLAAHDVSVGRALMLEEKSHGKMAMFVEPVAGLLRPNRVVTTADFIRASLRGSKLVATVEKSLSTHAAAIAALLDAPRVAELVAEATRPAQLGTCPSLGLAVGQMIKRDHREVTTRHLVLVFLRTQDALLKKHDLSGVGEAISATEALLDRLPRRTADMADLSPRLIGALAEAVARTDMPFPRALRWAALRGDTAMAFAGEVLTESDARIAAAIGAHAPPPTGASRDQEAVQAQDIALAFAD